MANENQLDSPESELNASELGTKEHWDRVYKDELNNFSSHGDVGEIWFGEESILRIVSWLCSEYHGSKDDFIIDIGCGNGMTLVELAREGFRNLVGIDYSGTAIQLAVSIVEEQKLNSVVSFKVCDILSDEMEESSMTIAIDKGTYDSISLDPINSKEKRSIYIKKVHNLLRRNGILIITSCNWTDTELHSQFSEYFSLNTVIATPEFKFAGKIGKLLSCVVLQRKN